MLKRLVFAALLAAGSGALAGAFDAAPLARFDAGFERCEQLQPPLRGQRDAAWLALWRTRDDEASRARLAKLRQGEVYRREQRRFAKSRSAPGAAPASSPVAHQCQALLAEKQKAEARQAAAAARGASRP